MSRHKHSTFYNFFYRFRRIFAATIFMVIGVVITIFSQSLMQNDAVANQKKVDLVKHGATFENLSHLEESLNNDDVFKEIRAMEERMDVALQEHRRVMKAALKKAHGDSNERKLSKSSIITKEDDDSYVYELNFNGFDEDSVDVKVNKGLLTFSAKRTEEKGDDKSKVKSSSSFKYSFSIPSDVEKDYEIDKRSDYVLVKFMKKKDKVKS